MEHTGQADRLIAEIRTDEIGPSSGPRLYYAGEPGGTETLTGTGTHVDADGLFKPSTGTSTATVHVSGDATCGSSTAP